MAKICINCQKKISFTEKGFRIPEAGSFLCTDCGTEAKVLFEEMQATVDLNAFNQIRNDFAVWLENAFLSADAKSSLRYAAETIAEKKLKKLVPKIDGKEMQFQFNGSFEKCCEIIQSCGAGNKVSITPVLEVNSVKIKTFVFEEYYVRSDSYVNLTVNLVHWEGTAYVSAIASAGGQGIFNISLGAEVSYLNQFWKNLHLNYPEIQFSGISKEILGREGRPVIGVLGGTFDPPHNGHISLGTAALEQEHLQKLIVMPAKVQPFKQDTKTADSRHRLAMTELAFANLPQVEVSDYEIENTNISYSYDTLMYLKEKYPDVELTFITGTDAFIGVDTWYKGIDLLESFSFLVSVRPGYRESELEEKIREFTECYGTKVEKIQLSMPDVSSTEVRELCRKGCSLEDKVPKEVERYIHEHGLYQ